MTKKMEKKRDSTNTQANQRKYVLHNAKNNKKFKFLV